MNKEELKAALDALCAARDKIDRAIEQLDDLLHTPTPQELSLQLAELEGWSAMETYMGGRKQ
jgi:hypothetical protein